MAKKQVITKTALRRLMKEEANANIVAAEAVTFLQEYLENIAIDVTKKALELARHSKRKTISQKDVSLAINH
jgi:histone H3/H4